MIADGVSHKIFHRGAISLDLEGVSGPCKGSVQSGALAFYIRTQEPCVLFAWTNSVEGDPIVHFHPPGAFSDEDVTSVRFSGLTGWTVHSLESSTTVNHPITLVSPSP